MKQALTHVALVVNDYDDAIDFYTNRLNFELVEDTYQPDQGKRWVLVAPRNSNGTAILLAKASSPHQAFHHAHTSESHSAFKPASWSAKRSVSSAPGWVENFTTTVCDGVWINTCCPFIPEAE